MFLIDKKILYDPADAQLINLQTVCLMCWLEFLRLRQKCVLMAFNPEHTAGLVQDHSFDSSLTEMVIDPWSLTASVFPALHVSMTLLFFLYIILLNFLETFTRLTHVVCNNTYNVQKTNTMGSCIKSVIAQINIRFKGIVHFEIKIWYLSAYPKGIQDVGVFFSSVDPILMFLGQTVLVCQSYNGRYRSLSL